MREAPNRDVDTINRGEELLLKARFVSRKVALEVRRLLDKWGASRPGPTNASSADTIRKPGPPAPPPAHAPGGQH
jgi:hypothetical protein